MTNFQELSDLKLSHRIEHEQEIEHGSCHIECECSLIERYGCLAIAQNRMPPEQFIWEQCQEFIVGNLSSIDQISIESFLE